MRLPVILLATSLSCGTPALYATPATSHGGSEAVLQISDFAALERSKAAIGAVASGTVECRLVEASTVRFVGPTDDSLLACIARHSSPGFTLLISSGGGDALKAIEAANNLAELGWSVTFRGMCASSCGNYLVPAATSLSVEPYSLILLHGGPIDSEGFIAEVQDQVKAQQRTAYPQVSDEAVLAGRQLMRSVAVRLIGAHQAFVHARGVRSEWYLLTEFEGPDGGFSQADFAVADPDYLARQAPSVRQDGYWFPGSPKERAALDQIISDAALFYRASR